MYIIIIQEESLTFSRYSEIAATQDEISISSKISASGGIYCVDVSTVRRYTVGVCCSALVMEGAF